MSLRSLVSQLLVCVVFEDAKFAVFARVVKGGKVTKTYEKGFEDKKKLLNYVESLTRNYQIYYTALFLDDVTQGLVPVSEISGFAKFGVDGGAVVNLPLPNAQIYAPKAVIRECKKLFANYGDLDFIFSPFMLLFHCINSKTKLKKDKITLCVYRHSHYVVLMICENKKILFGKFFDISLQNKDEESLEELDEEIDDIKFDDEPNLEALSEAPIKMQRSGANELPPDIAGLVDDESVENPALVGENSASVADLSSFGDDMDMCSCIFGAVQDFYNNPLYAGRFIDEMVLFNEADLSSAVIDYIQGEIFITPELVKIDTFALMSELMQKELGL